MFDSAKMTEEPTALSRTQSFQSGLWLRISAFLDQKSLSTQKTYVGVLREFCHFLGCEAGTEESAHQLLTLTEMHVLAYRSWLGTKEGQRPRVEGATTSASREVTENRASRPSQDGLSSVQSNATVAKKLSILRRIYKVICRANLGVSRNPFECEDLAIPRKDRGQKRPTEIVTAEEVVKMLELPNTETEKGRRDRAILSLLFGGGLRRGELLNLRISDLRYSQSGTPFLYLRATKGGGDANHALPEWVGDILLAWRRERDEQGAKGNSYLFTAYTGRGGKKRTEKSLSETALYLLFKRYASLAGVSKFVSPHSARATAITTLLHDGWSHRKVQTFSRHKSVAMVEVYDKKRTTVDESPGRSLSFSQSTGNTHAPEKPSPKKN